MKRLLYMILVCDFFCLKVSGTLSNFFQRYRFFGSAFVRKPLYQWGALKAESEIARFQQSISTNNYEFLLSELKSITRDSYLDLVVLKDQLQLNIDTLELAEV